VDDRIEGHPAEEPGGAVAEAVCREGMGELVDREADQQEERDEDELLRTDAQHAAQAPWPVTIT
jgi:hypothetical protein